MRRTVEIPTMKREHLSSKEHRNQWAKSARKKQDRAKKKKRIQGRTVKPQRPDHKDSIHQKGERIPNRAALVQGSRYVKRGKRGVLEHEAKRNRRKTLK